MNGWWKVEVLVFSDTGSPAEWDWPAVLDDSPEYVKLVNVEPVEDES